ncbi:hypothetical protein H2203_008636 [Taxawa tesnikishii (nom. ined.)]|nr:hypothetical protein H2203_008636 [Dothideales sp. JES 119]
MDDPLSEIEGVIHSLVQTPPDEQAITIRRYFTPNAQFTHPLCRTGSFANSRYLVERIYRCKTFDTSNMVMYVGITQVFKIWAIPFHHSEVSLVTVLHLEQGRDRRYYISSQNDLYQTDQWPRFLPFVRLFAWMIPLVQLFATLVCVVSSYALRL